MLVWRFFRWLEGYIEYGNLPYTCQNCELLGLCRRPKEEGWKCYNGCRVIKERENKTARKKK